MIKNPLQILEQIQSVAGIDARGEVKTLKKETRNLTLIPATDTILIYLSNAHTLCNRYHSIEDDVKMHERQFCDIVLGELPYC